MVLIKAMTECKCKNNEMVTKEECEKAETSAWWDGVLNTLKIFFGAVMLVEAGVRLAEVDLRLNKLERDVFSDDESDDSGYDTIH